MISGEFDDPSGTANVAGGWHTALDVPAARLDDRPLDFAPWDRAAEPAVDYAERSR